MICFKVKELSAQISKDSFEGKVLGVNSKGALKIFTKNGLKELYSSRHIEYI